MHCAEMGLNRLAVQSHHSREQDVEFVSVDSVYRIHDQVALAINSWLFNIKIYCSNTAVAQTGNTNSRNLLISRRLSETTASEPRER